MLGMPSPLIRLLLIQRVLLLIRRLLRLIISIVFIYFIKFLFLCEHDPAVSEAWLLLPCQRSNDLSIEEKFQEKKKENRQSRP